MACLAIFVAAAAPTLAHVLRSGADSGWVEVCSALGTRLVKVDLSADRSGPAPDQGRQSEHCPYCSLHATALALPPVNLVAVGSLFVLFEVPRLVHVASGPRYAWAAPQSRAPPLAS
jgi:hypothetical protein